MSSVVFRKFSELGTVIAGQHIPADQYNGDESGTPYLTGPADFTDRRPTVTKWTTQPRSFSLATDVLLTVKGAGCGKSNLGINAAIGRQLMALRPDPALLDRNYLFNFIRSREEPICALGQGATVPGIAKGDIEKLEIPYLPLSEQRRIAAILDKADAIRRKREEGIRLTTELLRSTFLGMFGDPTTDSNGWPLEPLGEHISFMTSGSRGWATYYADSGARFIRSLDVQMNRIGDDDVAFVNPPDSTEAIRTRVRDGDVLITITGSKVGRAAFVPEGFGQAYVSQHVVLLSLFS
jgi:type I restriction enzyme, S subunit